MMGKSGRWQTLAIYALISIGALVCAHLLVRAHGFHLIYDAGAYYRLGKALTRAGLFGLPAEAALVPGMSGLLKIRTYGYPLFVALCCLFSEGTPRLVHWVVFEVQLGVLLAVCYGVSRIMQELVPQRGLGPLLYACTTLNPWVLIRTSELLADSLSISLCYLTFALLLRTCARPGTGAARTEGLPARYVPGRGAVPVLFLAGFCVMLRPVNLAVVPAFLLLWLLGPAVPWRHRLAALPLLALAFALPFIPQAVNNYRLCGRIKPLLVSDIYHQSQIAGMLSIKRAGFDHPHYLLLIHNNPLLESGISRPEEFRHEFPIRYGLTCALHIFSFFDQDNPFTYIRRSRSWYRWPSSVLSFLFLGLCGYGARLALRRARQPGRASGPCFVWFAIVIVVGCQLLAYMPAHVEARYAASVYLFLSPLLVLALFRIRLLFRCRKYRCLATLGGSLGLFVAGCCGLSAWLDTFSQVRLI
jgi:hypothetical protein